MAETSTELSYKVIGHLTRILQRPSGASRTDIKELDKDLGLLGQADADALVGAGSLDLLLKYLTVDQHFEVIAKCLIALSTFDSSRTAICDMEQEGIPKLAQVMLSTARGAKAEKLVEKASQLAKILVLYSIDAPDDQQVWIKTLCQQLAEALEHGFTKNGQQDAYTYLSVALPAMWVSMGTSLAPIMAAHIIETGGMPLLLRAAREVQRTDIKGMPKIIGEKALNLLCACNSEQPRMSLQHIDVGELAAFCVETVLRSDWVQSQELSVVLLGRLVFSQRALSEEYLSTEPVVRMIQHALHSKSPALRMTTLTFSLVCSEQIFELVCVEANKVIVDLGQVSGASIKRLGGPTSGTLTVLRWGRPINKFAQDLLRGSVLLARLAESTPAHLPAQFVDLLTPELKQYVAGVKATQGTDKSTPQKRSRSTVSNAGGDSEDYDEEPVRKLPKIHSTGANLNTAGAASSGKENGHPFSYHPTPAHMSDPQPFKPGFPTHQPGLLKPGVHQVGAAPTMHEGYQAARGGPMAGGMAGGMPRVSPRDAAELAAARVSAGGGASTSAPSAAAAALDPNRKVTALELSQLNEFLLNLGMQSQGSMSDKANHVFKQLMQAMERVAKLLPLKSRLPPPAQTDCDSILRSWLGRVRQMATALQTAKGPALDMLLSFANIMHEEVGAYLTDAEQQTKAAAPGAAPVAAKT